MLKNLFGKKEDKGYFLEIEEKPQTKTVKKVAKVESNKEGSTDQTPTTKPSTPSYQPNYNPPEWVKAIKNYSNTELEQVQENVNFSTNYLMGNTPQSRRRPGPSLNPFKAMASKMKK